MKICKNVYLDKNIINVKIIVMKNYFWKKSILYKAGATPVSKLIF